MKGNTAKKKANYEMVVAPSTTDNVQNDMRESWKGRCVSELEEGDTVVIMSKEDYYRKEHICKAIEHQRDGMIDTMHSAHDVIVSAMRQAISKPEEWNRKALETLGMIALALEE